jgi:pimeloyl-ACP methyl ester carboxylesterase
MSRKNLVIALGALLATTGLAFGPLTASASTPSGPTAVATTPATAVKAGPIAWGRCKDRDLRRAKAECGRLTVPLDHAAPTGPTIELAVSRVLHTKGPYRGAVFTNPGGPGGPGLQYSRLGGAIPHGVGKTYDWYGLDTRGVGASSPSLECDKNYFPFKRKSYHPSTADILSYWLTRSDQYAAACAASPAASLLAHMKTTDIVADFEALRVAIGQSQVTFYGFSYGTYIATVWATLHPTSLKALVLDGVVNPTRVWYSANIDQDYAFGTAFRKFFGWVAKYNSTYHLGRTAQQVQKNLSREEKQLGRKPAGGKLGPAEFEDSIINAGYINAAWPDVAQALSDLINADDPRGAIQLFRASYPAHEDANVGYLATSCTDAPWPKDWNVWAADTAAADQSSPFFAWNNAWFNAPCRNWPVPAGTPTTVSGAGFTGPVLLVNETFDAATPFSGALVMRSLFPTSVLIEGKGGTTHAASLSGVSCVDDAIAKLLKKGALPSRKAGNTTDKVCPGLPAPTPVEEESGRLALLN